MITEIDRWIDRLVVGGLVFLVAYTPFAFGAVYRGSFVLMETTIFALVVLWMAKVWLGGSAAERAGMNKRASKGPLAPIAALLALIFVQLVPLPPRILRAISPYTYATYQVAFPGWPIDAPYRWLSKTSQTRSGVSARSGSTRARSPRERALSSGMIAVAGPRGISGWRWRSLSVSPLATTSGLLEASALAGVFFLTLLYPPGLLGDTQTERRFTRTLLVAMIATAVAVAMLGLAERAWWNGRIFWRYVPEDWPGPWLTEAPRSSGPFVNPDHFANYLAMTLPLTVLGIAFACPWAPGKHRNNTRAVSACAALVIAVALALSLSRAGWLAAATGACGAVALCSRFARADAPIFLRRLPVRTTPLTIAGFAILLAVVVYLMGPTGRIEAGHRIALTSAGELAQNRRENWSDTLRMIGRFPIAGIGLGCWPDLFPQFQRPPWQPIFFREAENDYLQFIAETGLVGLALLVWFACVVGVRVKRATRSLTPREWPLFAGLLGGLGAVVLHEAFDFSLPPPPMRCSSRCSSAYSCGSQLGESPGCRGECPATL